MGLNVYCFYHFRKLINFCSEFLRRSFGTVFKTAFHVYRWSFRERRTNLLKNTYFFTLFWEFEHQNYGVWCGSFMHGCQNCILHVRRNNSRKIWYWGKKFTVLSLSKFNQNMFGVLAEKVRHGGQTCISHLQMILPRKKNNFLEKHIIFHTVLRIWASKLRNLVWKFHARLSKLHSTCTKEQFEKKLVLGKNLNCFLITFEI